MSNIDLNSIVGIWRNVRSEIPEPFDPKQEFLRIGSDGFLFWDYPTGPKTILKTFRYELTNNGIKLLTLKRQIFCELEMRFENDFLVLKGTHGYTSWYTKWK